MKKTAIILAILAICALMGAALAESAPAQSPLETSAGEFLDSLGQTWDAFLGMTQEAGNAVGAWAADVQAQTEAFLAENMPELKGWLDEAGEYFNQQVAPEISAAYETLLEGAAEAGAHTREELTKAYETLRANLEASNTDPKVMDALNGIAQTAGVAPAK